MQKREESFGIFPFGFITSKSIAKDDLFVIGIANGELGAMELIEKITQEVYDETKGTDIRGFILQKQKEYEERNV